MLCIQYQIPKFTQMNFLPFHTFFSTIIFLQDYFQSLLLKWIETAEKDFCKQVSYLIIYYSILKTEGGISAEIFVKKIN